MTCILINLKRLNSLCMRGSRICLGKLRMSTCEDEVRVEFDAFPDAYGALARSESVRSATGLFGDHTENSPFPPLLLFIPRPVGKSTPTVARDQKWYARGCWRASTCARPFQPLEQSLFRSTMHSRSAIIVFYTLDVTFS